MASVLEIKALEGKIIPTGEVEEGSLYQGGIVSDTHTDALPGKP